MGEGSFIPKQCPVGVGVPEEEDVEMMHPMASGKDTFCLRVRMVQIAHVELDVRIALFL